MDTQGRTASMAMTMATAMATLPSSCHSRGSTSSTLTQGHKCQEQSNHTQCVCTARVCVCVRLATMAARGVGAKDPQAKNKNDQSPIGQHFIFGSARKYATSTLPHPHSHTPTYIHYLQCFQHTHTHIDQHRAEYAAALALALGVAGSAIKPI